jgi:cytochrome-b5 reductase
MKKELDDWEQRFPERFQVTYVITKPVEGSRHVKGHLTKDMLSKVLEVSPPSSKVFLSGPPARENTLMGARGQKGILEELGFTKSQIHKF